VADIWDQIAEDVGADTSNLATTSIISQKRNPALVARARKLSAKYGVPSPVIEAQPEPYEMQDRKEQAETVFDAHPWMVPMLAEDTTLAGTLGKDDLPRIGDISNIFGITSPKADYRLGAAARVELPGRGPAPPAAPPLPSYGKRVLTTTGAVVGTAVNQIIGGLAGVGENVTDIVGLNDELDPFYRQLEEAQRKSNEGLMNEVSGWVTPGVKRGAFSAAVSLTQLGATAPAGASAVLPLLAGITYGNAYQKYQGRDAGIGRSMLGAGLEGGLEYATERLPVGYLTSKLGKGTVKDFLTHVVLGETLGEQIATAGQSLTEAMIAPEGEPQTFKEWLLDPQRGQDAWETLVASTLMVGAIGGTNKAMQRLTKASDAAVDTTDALIGQSILEDIMTKSEKVEMRTTAPEDFARFVNEGAKGSQVRNVYIPVEAIDAVLADETLDEEDRAALTLYQDQIEEARVNNGEVVIPIGDAAASFAGTKVWQTLKDDARVLAGGISGREAKEQMKTIVEELEAIGNQTIEEGRAAVPELVSKAEVYNEIKSQVLAAGRSDKEAQTTAVLLASRAENLASARYGKFASAAEAWKWMQLKIVGADTKVPKGKAKKAAQAPFKDLTKLLDRDDWALMTAENPNAQQLSPEENAARLGELKQALDAMGLKYTQVRGKYDNEENSLAIEGISEAQARALGERFGQDSVLTRRGLIYRDNTINPATGVSVLEKDADNYFTELPDGTKFSIDIDFDQRVPVEAPFSLQQSATVGGYEGLAPFLTNEEKHNLKDASKKKIMAIAESLPDAEEMAAAALAGRAKRGWYENSAQAILDVFGPADAPRFAALLAALSPQTSVESNLYNALKTWTNWNEAGRPTSRKAIVEVMGNSVQGGKGVGSILNSWINNAVTALTAENPAQITLSGPKVDSFMNNLVGVVDEVTNDTWMANYSAITPEVFRSIGGKKGPGYKAMNAVVRKAADILTQKTGELWTPAEVQETVWSFAKTLYEARDVAGERRDMQQLLEAGHVTHNDIANTPDFAVLFADGIYRTILEEAGYSTGSLGSNRRTVGVDGSQSIGEAPEASGFSADDYKRFLAQAAYRLETVRAKRRGVEVQRIPEDQFGFPFEDVMTSEGNGEHDPMVLQQFGGEVGALNASGKISMLHRAGRMEGEGRSPEDIWSLTGWMRGPDGKWRFEIDDSEARLVDLPSPEPVSMNDVTPGIDYDYSQPTMGASSKDGSLIYIGERLDTVLKHQTLFEHYPMLRNVGVFHIPLGERDHGMFDGFNIILNSNIEDDETKLSTVLHEVQHSIQAIEGFANGASPDLEHFAELGIMPEYEAQLAFYEAVNRGEVTGWAFPDVRTPEQLEKAAKYQTYFRVLGEVEARNTQFRRTFSSADRRGAFPTETTDIFDNEVIVPSVEPMRLAAASQTGPTGPTKTPRGEATFYPDGRTVVQLFGKADFSTMLHEMSHVFLQQEFTLAQDPAASEELKADIAKLTKWFEVHGGALEGGMPNAAAHELFARTGERYFREGQAPSAELRSAFKQFKTWLTGVYKSVKDLLAYGPAPINPEIREIMDRMIATSEAIDANATAPLSQDELGMTDSEYAAYLDSVQGARDDAYDTLLNRMMAAIRRRETAKGREQRSNVKAEIAQQVNAEPRFIALHLLRTGRWLGDASREATPVKINTGWLIDNYGEDVLKQLPVGLQPLHRGDGMVGDDIAAMINPNYTGDALVNDLLDLKVQADALKAAGNPRPLRDHLIEQATDAEMALRHGDVAMSAEEIEEEAIAALNANRQGEVLATELRQLKKIKGKPGVVTPYQLLREWARRKVNEGTVADAVSKQALQRYIRGFNKARNAFEEAILGGKSDEAIKQKQAQMINHALLAEGKVVADEVNAIVRRMNRYSRTKAMASIDQDYMDRIHELLEGYNFRTVSDRQRAQQASFETWAEGQRAQGHEVHVPNRFRDDRTNWKDAKVAKLLELNDMVQSLVAQGKLKQRLLTAAAQRDLQETLDDSESRILQLPPRKLPEASTGQENRPFRQRLSEAKTFREHVAAVADLFRPAARVREGVTGLLKIEGLMDILDGTKDGTGPLNQTVVQPATEAANTFSRLLEEVMDPIVQRYKSMSRKQAARMRDFVTINELTLNVSIHEADTEKLGQPLTIPRMKLVGLILNTGNLSNLSKLVGGERWGDPESATDLARVRDILVSYASKEDMDLVQDIWNGIGKLWPHIAKVERELSGIVPEEVVPMPFETRYGPYSGGYWPVVWDSTRSEMGKKQGEEAETSLQGVGFGIATPKGHTITRTGAMAPMEWSTEKVLFSHTTKVIARVAYAPWVRDTLKIVDNPRITGAIRLRLGNEYVAAIKPWIRDQIPSNMQDVQGAKSWEKFLNQVRVNMSIAVLGVSYTTGVAQTLGLGYSAGALGEGSVKDGGKWVARGIYEMLRLAKVKGPGVHEFVFSRSEEMQRRVHEVNQEATEVFRKLRDDDTIFRRMQAAAFWHIGFIDVNMVAIPTWLGGYHKALEQGHSEAEAVHYADKMVRLSQSSGRRKDLSAIQRGNAGQKFISMFYTPSSVFFNQQWEAAQHLKAGNWSKALAPTFWFLVMTTIADAMREGDWPEDDDEDGLDALDIGEWASRNILFGLFYGIPVARDVANAAERKMRGEYAEYGTTPLSALTSTVGRGAKSTKKMVEGEELEGRDVKNQVAAMGFLFGLPGNQLGKSAGFVKDVYDGRVEADTPYDWYHGLVYGKPPPVQE